MKEILKVRKAGRDVIIFSDHVYYSEIVLHCRSDVTAEKVAVRLVYAFSDINDYLEFFAYDEEAAKKKKP